MNDKIRQVNPETLIFFDIETATIHKKLDSKSEMFKTFQYKNRNRETGELPGIKETQELYDKIGGLSPIYSKIVAIGILYIKDNKFNTKVLTGEESDILKEFYKIMVSSSRRPVGFNSTGFDVPFMRQRSATLDIEVPHLMNDVGEKLWDMDAKVWDLCKLWQGTNFSRYSLEEVCLTLGVKSSKNTGVMGAEVSAEYHKNGTKNIEIYVTEDCKSTANVFLRMQGKSIIE